MSEYRLEMCDVVKTFPGVKALNHAQLKLKPGTVHALMGENGAGKSTLMKCMFGIYHMDEGKVIYEGQEVQIKGPLDALNRGIAMVHQELQPIPARTVAENIWLGRYPTKKYGIVTVVDHAKMYKDTDELLKKLKLEINPHAKLGSLSIAQMQMVEIAKAVSANCKVLILDEPTSQLDPIAASDFLNTVKKINRELGTTVLITEHRLEDIFHAADRCVVMENGRILADDDPKKVGQLLYTQKNDMFAAMPAPVRIFYGAGERGAASPLTVREGRSWLTEKAAGKKLRDTLPPQPEFPEEIRDSALEVKEIWFRYEKDSPDILKGVSFRVPKGTLFSIVGGNGTGKSTTLKAVCGICRPYRGKVRVDGQDTAKCRDLFHGKLAMLPQDPQCLFVKKTVREDLEEMLPASCPDKDRRIADMARLCDITALLEHHPYDLSGGEQQRSALAKVLLTEPKLLLLDEPTKGLDSFFKRQLAGLLRRLMTEEGVTIVMVSHDVEFCAEYADSVSMFFDGQLLTTNTPRRFFAQNSFYTTAANRMSRHLFPQAVTAEDVVTLMKENQLT